VIAPGPLATTHPPGLIDRLYLSRSHHARAGTFQTLAGFSRPSAFNFVRQRQSAAGKRNTYVFIRRGMGSLQRLPVPIMLKADVPSASSLTKLIFHRYGTPYFISQVWVTGNIRTRAPAKPSRETRFPGSPSQRKLK